MSLSVFPFRFQGTLASLLSQTMIKEEAAFVSVPSLSLSDVSSILSTWLGGANRALTDDQFRFVVNAFNNCQLPLFLKLCFDQGCTWASYDAPALAEAVRSMISLLFRLVNPQNVGLGSLLRLMTANLQSRTSYRHSATKMFDM